MKFYRLIALVLAISFAVTGLLFLFIPDQVLILFNTISDPLGMPVSPVTSWSFYLILAVGYMYLVTVLAFLMFRYPENKYFPQLLAQAKIASSLLSLALFLFHAHYLIYLANFIIDSAIGAVVVTLYVIQGRLVQWASY
jgi:hypothetical protein